LRSAGGDVVERVKWMQRWPFRSFAEKKWFTTADAVDLPDYVTP
jgi:hypothetical protein